MTHPDEPTIREKMQHGITVHPVLSELSSKQQYEVLEMLMRAYNKGKRDAENSAKKRSRPRS